MSRTTKLSNPMSNPERVTCVKCGKPYSSFAHDCGEGLDQCLVRHFPINSELSVRAWWWPDARLVRCRVMEHWSTSDRHMTVQPIEGNTHKRTVTLGRDFDLPNEKAKP